MRIHLRLFIPIPALPFFLFLLIILSSSFQIVRTEEIDVSADGTQTIVGKCDNNNDEFDYLKAARKLKPPLVESTDHGDSEGAEWWLKHEDVIRRAWTQWEEGFVTSSTEEKDAHNKSCNSSLCLLQQQQLPLLNASRMIHPTLHRDVYRTWKEPTPKNEQQIHRTWEEVLSIAATTKTPTNKMKSKSKTKTTTTTTIIDDDDDDDDDEDELLLPDKVFRYQNFLTPEGVRALRTHLDAISESGIPTRRPNAMNRNGLLLDPTVPGGVAGDADAALYGFIENILVRDFLRPLGRSFFPAFCGDPEDDTTYYAFTIRYGHDDDHDDHDLSSSASATTPSNTTSNTTTTDLELKEHSDASVFTLNLNLNLPDEEYSGSSLYFVTSEEDDADDDDEMNASSNSNSSNAMILDSNNNTAQQRQQQRHRKRRRRELQFESGTALLHRGMTRHGALPLESGRRNNLVIWLHGKDGYVRTSPYEERDRLSVSERWSLSSSLSSSSTSKTKMKP